MMMLTTTTTTMRVSATTSTIGSRGSGSGKGQQRRAPLSLRKRGTTAASAIGKVTAAPAINDNENSTHELVFLCAREAMERARQKTKDDESTGSSILDQCNLQSAHVFTLAATTMVDKNGRLDNPIRGVVYQIVFTPVVRESSFDVVPERELDAPAVDDVETGDRSIFELVS